MPLMTRLIVGLGNPGPQYEATRHNAGFWWLDEAASRLGVRLLPERSYFGLAGRTVVGGEALWLLKPQTFMNLSGKAVAALARFFKVEPGQILVVHDELDLPPGQLRLKRGGGNGGHNGLKDIQAQLGSADTWRLRLGVGHPGQREAVVGHVLRTPPADEAVAIQRCIEESMQSLPLLAAGDMATAVQRLHAKPPRPKPAPRPPSAGGARGVPHSTPDNSQPHPQPHSTCKEPPDA